MGCVRSRRVNSTILSLVLLDWVVGVGVSAGAQEALNPAQAQVQGGQVPAGLN
jgi:hypothetical protein